MLGLAAALWLATAPAVLDYSGWSAGQLVAERERLEAARPSTKLSDTLLISGGALFVGSAFAAAWALASTALAVFLTGGVAVRVDQRFLGACGVVTLTGLASAIVGIIVGRPAEDALRETDRQLQRVNAQLEQPR